VPLSVVAERQSRTVEGWLEVSVDNLDHSRVLRVNQTLGKSSHASQVRVRVSLLAPELLPYHQPPSQIATHTHSTGSAIEASSKMHVAPGSVGLVSIDAAPPRAVTLVHAGLCAVLARRVLSLLP